VGPKSSDWCSYKRQEGKTQSGRRGRVTTEAENGVAENGAKNTKGHHQRLGERPGTDFPSVPPEETNPATLISEP